MNDFRDDQPSMQPWDSDFTAFADKFFEPDTEGEQQDFDESLTDIGQVEALIDVLERDVVGDESEYLAWVYATPEDRNGYRLAVRQATEIDQDVLEMIAVNDLEGVEAVSSTHLSTEMAILDRDGRQVLWFSNETGDPVGIEYHAEFTDFPVQDARESSFYLFEASQFIRHLGTNPPEDEASVLIGKAIEAIDGHMDVVPETLQMIHETGLFHAFDVTITCTTKKTLGRMEGGRDDDVLRQLAVEVEHDDEQHTKTRYVYWTDSKGTTRLRTFYVDAFGNETLMTPAGTGIDHHELRGLVQDLEDFLSGYGIDAESIAISGTE